MEQGTYGGGNVGHVVRLGSGTMLNVPSHEDQRNVDVVRIPSAVAGALRYIVLIMGRLQNNLHASAALTVVAVDGTELQLLGNAFGRGLLHVEGIVHNLLFLQTVDYHLFHGSIVETSLLDGGGVEEHLIVHDCHHEVFVGVELSLELLVKFLDHRFPVPDAGRYALVLQEGGIVDSTMVGSEEGEIVALADGLVEIGEEVGKRLVEAQIAVFGLNGVDSHLMADVVGARAADGEQVGVGVLPKFSPSMAALAISKVRLQPKGVLRMIL